MIMKAAFYIVFLFSLFSCGNSGRDVRDGAEEEGGTALPVLDLEYVYDHPESVDTTFLWNDIITNERFVPLETTEDCLIGGTPWDVTRIGDHFLLYQIWAGKAPLLQFDSLGRYIKRFARFGKGPGEMISTLHHVIPFREDSCVMLDCGYKTIVKNRNGMQVRDLTSPAFRSLYPHDSGFVYVNQYQRFADDSVFLCFADSLGTTVRELKAPGEKRINPDLSDTPFSGLDFRKIFFTDEKLWLLKSYNDTLFRITPERTIEPYLILHRGKYSPVLHEKDREILGIGEYKEIGKYSVIASAVSQLWDREQGKPIARKAGGTFGALAVFDYRFPDGYVMPLRLMEIKDGQLIFLITPSEYDGRFLTLKEDDNPVLMVAELKEN